MVVHTYGLIVGTVSLPTAKVIDFSLDRTHNVLNSTLTIYQQHYLSVQHSEPILILNLADIVSCL